MSVTRVSILTLCGVVLIIAVGQSTPAVDSESARPAILHRRDAPDADVALPAPAGDGRQETNRMLLDDAARRISFQALLTNDQGGPIPMPNGLHELDFRLYASEAGGVPIGTVLDVMVTLDGGVASTQVGPMDPTWFDGTARWMGVTVDNGDELEPLIPLGSVPYAFRVDRVASEELDDFIDLGSPAASGYLAIFGGQATPTFTVDANLNSLSLFSDDNTGSTGMFAESGAGYVAALSNNEIGAYLDGDGSVWAETSVIVGDIESNFTNNTVHAALQSGVSFGGRLLSWDVFGELTAMIGSSANREQGGVIQLYRGGAGGLTVEIDGEDGTGSGRAIWRNADSDTTVEISALDHRIYTFGADDEEHARLGGSASGNLQLRGGGPDNPLTVNLNSGGGGMLDLYDTGGNDLGVRLEGGSNAGGGRVRVYNAGNNDTVEIEGNFENSGAGAITIRGGAQDRILLDAANHRIRVFDPAGTETIRLFGNGGGGGGGLSLRNSAGDVTIELDSDDASDSPAFRVIHADGTNVFVVTANNRQATLRGGVLRVQNDSGQTTCELDGDAANSGVLRLRRADGTLGLLARATEGTGSELNLYNGAGQATVQIDTDWNGNGNSRIVANEFQITGGSDLAEGFDVSAVGGPVEPGMIVCIDPTNPGKLIVCNAAYDRRVAGIVSGAGGVRPGMLMGQAGSEADGQYPVALTGRVYVWADATGGSIQPGDLLTSSNTPGHAMKVTDYARANGSIIGKAMSGLQQGETDLLLVLVGLQ